MRFISFCIKSYGPNSVVVGGIGSNETMFQGMERWNTFFVVHFKMSFLVIGFKLRNKVENENIKLEHLPLNQMEYLDISFYETI